MPELTQEHVALLEKAATIIERENRKKEMTPVSKSIDAKTGKPKPGTGVSDAPAIRTGEDPLSSRPMYMYKAAQVASGRLNRSKAKMECEFSDKLKKAMCDHYGDGGTQYSENSVLVPLAWSLMPEDIRRDNEFMSYQKSLHAAVADVDPEEALAAAAAGRASVRVYKTAMSYLNQTTGGALVAPPQFGDLIPILRNKAVLPNIGAKNVPLPAQGSVKYPRQTGVTTFEEKPENTSASESNPTFDDVTLEPKQFIGLVRLSNQLLTFSQGIAEAAIREDMAEQIALKFDLSGLEGVGGPNKVRGLVNQTGITTITAKSTGTNGDTWSPADTSRMLRAAMTRNSDIKTFIMRPDMWLGITETRADAVTPGDAQGAYLFHMLRQFSDDFGETLRQRKVVTSNQVSQVRAKGSASNLTYILGVNGEEILVGMHGAMVLDMNPYETTAFSSNQSLLRAIMFGDVAVRRGAGIVLLDDLIVPNLD